MSNSPFSWQPNTETQKALVDLKVFLPPWSSQRGGRYSRSCTWVHCSWGAFPDTLHFCSLHHWPTLPLRTMAAVVETKFHAERLAVMWPGQTWAERLSAEPRLKQKGCPHVAQLPTVKAENQQFHTSKTKLSFLNLQQSDRIFIVCWTFLMFAFGDKAKMQKS